MNWFDYARISIDLLWQSATAGDPTDLLVLAALAATLVLGAVNLIGLFVAAAFSLFSGPRS